MVYWLQIHYMPVLPIKMVSLYSHFWFVYHGYSPQQLRPPLTRVSERSGQADPPCSLFAQIPNSKNEDQNEDHHEHVVYLPYITICLVKNGLSFHFRSLEDWSFRWKDGSSKLEGFLRAPLYAVWSYRPKAALGHGVWIPRPGRSCSVGCHEWVSLSRKKPCDFSEVDGWFSGFHGISPDPSRKVLGLKHLMEILWGRSICYGE